LLLLLLLLVVVNPVALSAEHGNVVGMWLMARPRLEYG